MTKRPFLRKWFTNGDDCDADCCMDEFYWTEDSTTVVFLDCDEEGVTIDPNDPYLDLYALKTRVKNSPYYERRGRSCIFSLCLFFLCLFFLCQNGGFNGNLRARLSGCADPGAV